MFWWFSNKSVHSHRLTFCIFLPCLSHSRGDLRNANAVNDFRETVAKGKGPERTWLRAASSAWRKGLPCSLSFHLPGFTLCPCKWRQPSWSAIHIFEQAEKACSCLHPRLSLHCLINEQFYVRRFMRGPVLTPALQPGWSEQSKADMWVRSHCIH